MKDSNTPVNVLAIRLAIRDGVLGVEPYDGAAELILDVNEQPHIKFWFRKDMDSDEEMAYWLFGDEGWLSCPEMDE